MLRSRPPSFHKSMPNINAHHHHNTRASSASRIPPTSTSSSKIIIGRDELEERYLDLRDRHLGLRKEATAAQEELRLLHVKLNRLLDEKKRYFRHRRTDREVALEETVLDLEQRLGRQAVANDRLRDRMQLMRVTGSGEEVEVKGHHPLHHHRSSHQSLVVSKRPYSHVQSRVDSGLGVPPPVFSFRPSSNHHHRSPSPSKSGILKHSNENSKLPLSATSLMREAKEEIIRLEEIIAEQQMMLDTLLSADPEEEEEGVQPSSSANKLPNSSTNSFSYQLTTTTTATASLTATGATTPSQTMSNGYHHPHQNHHHLDQHQELLQQNGSSSSSPAIVDLYTKYQQLIMRQESTQKLSTDVRALIESLYRSLREEKAKVAELRAKLAAKDELNLVITEKDTQIENLRKENALLQQSLTDCIAQCMESPAFSQEKQNLNSGSEMSILSVAANSTSKYLEALKSTLAARSEAAQKEAEELGKRLAEAEVQLNSEKSRNNQLQAQYATLQQLSESDALHVGHLQAKIARLNALLFSTTETQNESLKSSISFLQKTRARSAAVEKQREKQIEKAKNEAEVHHRISELSESSEEEESVDKNSNDDDDDKESSLITVKDKDEKVEEEEQLESFINGTVTDELDQLLNSFPR